MTVWLMLQSAIDRIEAFESEHVAQAELDNAVRAGSPMRMGRGGVANIDVKGPLLSKRSNMLDFFGVDYTVYGDIESQIGDAMKGGAKRIDFHIDSPGGTIHGLYSAMDAIKNAPLNTRALASGTCASAAYMLASQTGEIVAENDLTIIGSIGVETRVDPGKRVTNTASPKKNPDGTTEQGASDLREQLDDIYQVLAEKVSMGRGISPETVKSEYGQGAVMTARTAFQRKMIDSIQQNITKPATRAAKQGVNMDAKTLKEDYRAVWDAVYEEGRRAGMEAGVESERARVKAHLIAAEGGDIEAAHAAIKDGSSYSDEVRAAHDAYARKQSLKTARVKDNPPVIGGAGGSPDEQKAAEAKAIADFQDLNPGCSFTVDIPKEVN